jgi:hypothetical protein
VGAYQESIPVPPHVGHNVKDLSRNLLGTIGQKDFVRFHAGLLEEALRADDH